MPMDVKQRATLSALDVVVKAVERHLALITDSPPEAIEPGVRDLNDAIDYAADNLIEVNLPRAAQQLRAEAEELQKRMGEYAMSVLSAEKSAEEIEQLKQFYGEFQTPPVDPEERNKYLMIQNTICRHRAEIIQQSALQIREVLASSSDPLESGLGEPGAIDEAYQTGFLGGRELLEALGVHPSQAQAFQQLLSRTRSTLGDGNWHEITDPRPNSPRFIYRVDTPEIRLLAKRYLKPKPI